MYNTHCKIGQKVKKYNLAISVSLIEFKMAEDIWVKPSYYSDTQSHYYTCRLGIIFWNTANQIIKSFRSGWWNVHMTHRQTDCLTLSVHTCAHRVTMTSSTISSQGPDFFSMNNYLPLVHAPMACKKTYQHHWSHSRCFETSNWVVSCLCLYLAVGWWNAPINGRLYAPPRHNQVVWCL